MTHRSEHALTDDQYAEQVRLELESRGLTIERYHEQLEKDPSNSDVGQFLMKNLINPVGQAISAFIQKDKDDVKTRKAIKHKIAAKLLGEIDPYQSAFLMLKTYLGSRFLKGKENQKLNTVAYAIGQALHAEVVMQRFAEKHKAWYKKVDQDLNRRGISPREREAVVKRMFKEHDLDFAVWSYQEMYHAGYALVDLFVSTTGLAEIRQEREGVKTPHFIFPTQALVDLIQQRKDAFAPLMSVYPPMIVKPRPWTAENLSFGGYLTEHLTPYQLVKRSRRAYRDVLKDKAQHDEIDIVLQSINALQETRWQINAPVLDVLEWAYHSGIDVKKVPTAHNIEPDPIDPEVAELPWDHEKQKAYRAHCFKVHEYNRNIVGARVIALRTMQMARKFSKYDEVFFPHDLDSRGRAYPKPVGLNPQGADFVKGLLRFADGKTLGLSGVYWLGVHGANCYGHDKLPIDARADWARRNVDLARAIARDPRGCLDWRTADNPFQFLAWCFEWAAAHEGNPEEFVSHLHVDLDATCSGLQHFSAMLRDDVGGKYVNMLPSDTREDIYQAVADLVSAKASTDTSDTAKLLCDIGVDRSITKRTTMVLAYSGTRQSCYTYVSDALKEKLGGRELTKDEWKALKSYASDLVWAKIPEVVIAADGAMRWLKKVSYLVGKSNGHQKRIEWETPIGFPVWQMKMVMSKRQVYTKFQGGMLRPNIQEETEKMDARKLSSSVPPSLVHSLDAAHMMLTVYMAKSVGMNHFAAVHDSFGVHAADVDLFAQIIRHAFVDMYAASDPLEAFLEANEPFISEELKEEIPEMPPLGNLDLQGILENEFFFS